MSASTGGPRSPNGQVVSGGYFGGLGVAAVRGRVLEKSDDRGDAPPVAVLSYDYWQRAFAGREDVLGQSIRVNNVAVTLVGVTPRAFRGALQVGDTPALTLPLSLEPRLRHGRSSVAAPLTSWLHIMGRLRPGATADGARAELEPVFVQALQDAWRAVPPQEIAGPDGRSLPLLRLESGAQGLLDVRRSNAESLQILMGIVFLVLLISCANVANLLLARSAARQKENAVRLAVGASRSRLLRQVLAESLLLALLGGTLGVLLAFWGRDALLAMRPLGTGPLELNLRVLAFTFGVSLITGLVFGLAPAWRATRTDPNTALKEGGGGARGLSRSGLRGGVMVAQVALSVVLLVGAGLFLRTLHNLRSTDTGFNRDHLVLFRVHAGLSGYGSPRIAQLFDRLLERLQATPGVRSAALSRHALLSGSRRSSGISLEGESPASGQDMGASVNCVSPGFFQTMEIPVLQGRDVSGADRDSAPRVALVNEAFVRSFLRGGNAIGRGFSVGPYRPDRRIEIVGVVRDALYADVRGGIPATVYIPFHQDAAAQANVAVRTSGDPKAVTAAVRAALFEVDPDVPLFDLRTQEEQISLLVAQERLFATLCTFFGLVALGLTGIGLYGLLAQRVTARTREIGIRMALGAQVRAVRALVMGEGLRLTVWGVALGLATALVLATPVSRLLFEVPASDPLVLLGTVVVLIGMALLACWLPARRAMSVDPMVALRSD